MLPPKDHLSGKAPAEKSRFVQTCNRLSLYLKEKGKIRDLNFAKFDATDCGQLIPAAPPPPAATTTVDLFGNIDAENCLPQYVILDSSSCEQEEEEKKEDKQSAYCTPTNKGVAAAQMTIFYGGQVMVLDDVPADRARDLMLMAKKGKTPNNNPIVIESKDKQELTAAAGGANKESSDLPIARRASLHKFLAKRKDRATVRAAPYPSPGGSSSGNEPSFDLNM